MKKGEKKFIKKQKKKRRFYTKEGVAGNLKEQVSSLQKRKMSRKEMTTINSKESMDSVDPTRER